MICTTGILDENIVIPYRTIRNLETCSQGFIPMGIVVTHQKEENGELVENRFSVTNRKKWLEFLKEKSGAGE